MAPCTPITPKNHRKRLSNDDKLKIIEESKKPGFCRKKTMDKYGIGRSVICNILKNQKEILTTVDSKTVNSKAKCLKVSKNKKLLYQNS